MLGKHQDYSNFRRNNIFQVSCGLNHTLALSADGNTVWAFGDGDYGKLGIDSTTAKPSPRPVDTFTDVGVKRVCCGTQFSVVLTKDGRLFTFGQGRERLIPRVIHLLGIAPTDRIGR